jgi:membrane fusion protein (multidrug efflux system)
MGVKVTFLRDADVPETSEAASRPANPTTLVPKAAIKTDGASSYAFVIGAAGVIDRRAITAGGQDGDRLEVVAGLRAGERVVVAPPATLAAGARVTVK